MCVSRCPFFVFSLSFVSGVWHLVAKTGEEETRPLQVEIPISPARPGEPSWVLCKHSCVGFWKVFLCLRLGDSSKIWLCSRDNYAWPTYGAIAASGLCSPSPSLYRYPSPSLSADDNRSHCFRFPPFAFVCELRLWISHSLEQQPSRQATSCVPDRVAAWLAVNFMVNYAQRLRYLTFCATLIEALTIPHPSLPVSILSHVRFRLPPF